MDAPVAQSWFLRKNEDGNIFGPLSFEQLARWASSAQVDPQDVLSTDQVTWIKAPMLEELGMDWLVELTSERYYGPTTLGAVQEFMRLGEINEQTFLINSCDGVRRQIGEMSLMLQTQPVSPDAAATAFDSLGRNVPSAAGIKRSRRPSFFLSLCVCVCFSATAFRSSGRLNHLLFAEHPK